MCDQIVQIETGICNIAAALAGDHQFTAGTRHFFNQNNVITLPGTDSGRHHAGGTGADHRNSFQQKALQCGNAARMVTL